MRACVCVGLTRELRLSFLREGEKTKVAIAEIYVQILKGKGTCQPAGLKFSVAR